MNRIIIKKFFISLTMVVFCERVSPIRVYIGSVSTISDPRLYRRSIHPRIRVSFTTLSEEFTIDPRLLLKGGVGRAGAIRTLSRPSFTTLSEEDLSIQLMSL